jgi:hypothetical protein
MPSVHPSGMPRVSFQQFDGPEAGVRLPGTPSRTSSSGGRTDRKLRSSGCARVAQRADRAGSTATILHHQWVAEQGGHVLSQGLRGPVHCAARREAHH